MICTYVKHQQSDFAGYVIVLAEIHGSIHKRLFHGRPPVTSDMLGMCVPLPSPSLMSTTTTVHASEQCETRKQLHGEWFDVFPNEGRRLYAGWLV